MFNMTHYSILHSGSKPKAVISTLKELNYKNAIICDNNMFGTLEFYYECKKQDIQPIISVQKTIEDVNFILIAKNAEGYRNLSRMTRYEEITKEDFLKYTENVFIIVSFYNENITALNEMVSFLTSNGLNLFAGIKNSTTTEEILQEKIIKSLDLTLVPQEISTHIKEEDYRITNSVRAIDEKGLYENFAIKNIISKDSYIKDRQHWLNNYGYCLDNLIQIINACEDDYSFGDPLPPKYKFCRETAIEEGLDENISEEDLFAYLSKKGLKDRLKLVPEDKHQMYIERLEYEIGIINQMKFPGYMLIVWDFTIAAKKMGIPVGPGRGSAAGSLVAYCLYITDLDPMPYGLLFERFLNPERVSMPDIDMDFCQSRRGEILDYVYEKYGKDNVAQIITFGQLGGKSVIRDCSRILSYPLHLADKFAKTIPETPGIKLAEAYEQKGAEIDAIISDDTHAQRVWKFSKKLEGTKKNLGVHAAGLVISNEDITEKCPKYHVGETQVVQYEGKYLEDVDLIKFDFLGLKTLSVIDSTIKMVKESKGIDIDLSTITYDDKKVFEYISTGQTGGMFQIESSGMQALCKRLQPDCFEDLVAILALYRPGPMESGMLEDFIQRKKGEQEVSYFFDDMTEALEPILKPTYGVIVYQEQVMQIVQEIGGFSLGESDIIRRAMGKKQIEYMNQKSEEFAERASEKGYKKEEAKELFGLIEKFAGYGFNKSHSAAYALVTYYTALLKCYYPVEFMASLMNFDYDKHDKLIPMIQTTEKMGITIRKPNINTSTALFSVDGDEIVYGLKAIKGVGADIDNAIAKRELGYDSLASFIKLNRSKSPKLNKRVFTGLVNSGALDDLASRAYLTENLDALMKITKAADFDDLFKVTQDTLFGGHMNLLDIIKAEKASLGHIYSNPFEDMQLELDKYDIDKYDDLLVGPNRIVGWIESSIVATSKKGNKYGRFNIVDLNRESEEVLIFARGLDKLDAKGIDLSKPVIIHLNKKDDGSLIINDIDVISTQSMSNNFVQKTEQQVKEEAISSEEIVIGDYEALLNSNASTIKIIDTDNSPLCEIVS